VLDADRAALGPFLAYHRLRLGLTPNQLASRTTTLASDIVLDIECGIRTALRPRPALALARGLELDDYDTDHFLYLAGCAPLLDWQTLAEQILTEVGLGAELQLRTKNAYAARRPPSARSTPPPSVRSTRVRSTPKETPP
jgi:hypothetical protein